MPKINFSLGEWDFLAKFWHIDDPATASDPLWIVAGTQKEFEDFVIKKRMMGLHFDYRYVASANVLRGLSRIRGFYIGTYKERLDWYQIEEAIQIIKSKGG
jgi:hypothetical protein